MRRDRIAALFARGCRDEEKSGKDCTTKSSVTPTAPLLAETIDRSKAILYNKGKRWTPSEEERMIDLLNSGMEMEAVAETLGRTPYAVSLRAAPFAAEDFLTALRLAANKSFAQSAPRIMADILKQWKLDEDMLRRALTLMPAHKIMVELGLIPRYTPEFGGGMHSTDLLIRLGILKPWTPPDVDDDESETADTSTEEETEITEAPKSEDKSPAGPTIEERMLQIVSQWEAQKSKHDLEKQLVALESNLSVKIGERISRLESIIEDHNREVSPDPGPVILHRLSGLDGDLRTRLYNLEDTVVTRLASLERQLATLLGIFGR